MKNKGGLIAFLIVVIAFVTFFLILGISSCNDAAYVESYTADVVIDSHGNITVDEYLVTNYRYLTRDVKTGKNHINNPLLSGVSYSDYQNDTASFDAGSAEVHLYKGDALNDNSAVEITDRISSSNKKIGDGYLYIDGREILTLDDMATFHFHFTIKGMVTSYNDCAELNYILFESFGCKVKNMGVTVTLPNNTESEEDVYCYGHGLSRGKIVQNGNNSIDYTSKNLSGDEPLEMRVVFPKSIVSEIDDNNVINVNMLEKIKSYEYDLYHQDALRNTIAIIINVVTVIVVIGMVLITIYVYKKYDKEFTPVFDKEYLRELPFMYTPAEMSFLYYFGRTNDEDVTATLLDLIRRGFIKLDYFGETDAKDPDFKFILDREKYNSSGHELLNHEKDLINWFYNHIGKGDEVSVKEIETYCKKYNNATQFETDGKRFKASVKEECKRRDWFLNLKNGKSKASSFGLIPIFVMVIIFIVCSLFVISAMVNYIILGIITFAYFIYVGTIKKRSVNGNEEYAKWKAFAHFLEDFSTMEDYPMPGIDIWEEYLVYATSLKLADKVMDQLKVKLPSGEFEDGTFTRTTYVHHHYGAFYVANTISTTMSRAHYTAVSTISAHNSSSHGGGGHGGGFSSGSSFGGGGGGFHGGR
ncbi:MAG: DUF2207 domain-containing protein [Bacilli bacterium]|nr:DUF2207 domain-containing protein [Bacilli bacterium]